MSTILQDVVKRFFALPFTLKHPKNGYSFRISDIQMGDGASFRGTLINPEGYEIESAPISVSLDEFKALIAMTTGGAINFEKIGGAMFDMVKGLFELALLGAAAKDKREEAS